MNFFKPWTWFNSEERKLKNEFLRLQIELARQQLETTQDLKEEKADSCYKPYNTVRLIDTTVIVTLNDGDILTKDGVDKEFYDAVKECQTQDELISLFLPSYNDNEGVVVETEEERRQVSLNLGILRNNPDFEINTNGDVTLKRVPLKMPAFVVGSFIEICERKLIATNLEELKDLTEKYEALKMFWYWTALNPIASSRNDLLSFVRREDIKITKNGLLQMYRKVVKVGRSNKNLVEAISNHYYKVKKNRKAPSNYRLMELADKTYHIEKVTNINPKGVVIGNLETLYLNLPSMSENRYTDNHTRSKDIRIGQVYREDEDKINLDNTEACSNGLTCSPLIQ